MILNLLFILRWWAGGDSNSRLPPCEDGTLTTELPAHAGSGNTVFYTTAGKNQEKPRKTSIKEGNTLFDR